MVVAFWYNYYMYYIIDELPVTITTHFQWIHGVRLKLPIPASPF
jgi:hypothetical protein